MINCFSKKGIKKKAEKIIEKLKPLDKKAYKALLAEMPTSIDWSELSNYESEDNTVSMQTMACSGDSCEIVDLV